MKLILNPLSQKFDWVNDENDFVPYSGATDNVNLGSYNLTADSFVSTVAVGTSPYACTSTTLNTNLNADLWDSQDYPLTTLGDLFVGGASGAASRLAAVAAGRFLRAAGVGSLPAWSTATIPATMAAGSILAFNTLNTGTAITSTSGLKVLQISGTTVSWNTSTGTGNSVFATSPTLATPTITTNLTLTAAGVISRSSLNFVITGNEASGTGTQFGSAIFLNSGDATSSGVGGSATAGSITLVGGNATGSTGATEIPSNILLAPGRGVNTGTIGEVTIGEGDAGADYTMRWNGQSNDFTWKFWEDEAYLESQGNLLLNSANYQYFRDTAIGIWSQADTFLDLFADGAVRIGNSSSGAPTTYIAIDSTGDTYWVGDGSGIPYGSCTSGGAYINWTQATAVQNTWYDISDADMVDGQLNLITHDGNGQLTVTKAGRYLINYTITVEVSAANTHVETAISINGTESTNGMGHNEEVTPNAEYQLNGTAILDLAASSTINLSIRTTDATTPNFLVEMMDLTCVMVGGT